MHTVIEIFSAAWWKGLSTVTLLIVLCIIAGLRNSSLKETIRIMAGALLLGVAILLHVYLIYLRRWNLQTSLPLQLCSLAGILSGAVLLWRNQFAYELLLYWGLPSAFYALLTPEMTQGTGGLFIYEYYISHGGIIFSALYLSAVYQMRPRPFSWLRIFLYSQLLLPIVGVADYFFNANYMYLNNKPVVSSPFVVGEWPWYILGLEAALLLHFYIIYLIFYFSRREKQSPGYVANEI